MRVLGAIVLIAAALAGCERSSTADTKAVVAPIFSDVLLESWGYRTTETGIYEQSEWEKRNFGPAQGRDQWIKGIQELKDWENTYYRFRVREEVYETPRAAQERIKRIRDIPLDRHEKLTPHWTLCDGVADGKIVYIVSTDSIKFADEALPSVISRIKKQVNERPTENKQMQAAGTLRSLHP